MTANIDYGPGPERLTRLAAWALLAACLFSLAACGGGGDDDDEPDPPKIAGIWAGTWEGIDSSFGPAAGTWQAEISQQGIDVKGPMFFGGDIDCAEGRMTGTADGETETVSGQVFRDPCPFNDWIFTAFNQDELIASGSWEKQGLSNGSFEGRRIAKFTGPQIRYVYPPGGRARSWVTIVGEQLTMDPVNDTLRLGEQGPVLVPATVSDTVITLQLPGNVSAPDELVLTTAAGEALSPKIFNTVVRTPETGSLQDINLGAANLQPGGIAFSVNGRRAFVANRGEGSVSMINSEMGQEWTSTVVLPGPSPANPVHAVVAGPAGRNVYAAGEGVIGVLHAHTMELLRTVVVPAGAGGKQNPQGIAVSPDGRWLLVSQAIAGGKVTILDVDKQFAVANTLDVPAGSMPRGIAASPDNARAFIAISGSDNEIWEYDFASATVSKIIAIGSSPASVAVTPDARRLYITNDPADTVNYYDLDTGSSAEIDLDFGAAPHAVAITPDGFAVYVSSSTNNIYLIDVLSDGLRPVDVGGPSTGVAVSPDGKRAYVSLGPANKIVEIGNQRTLRISKQGGGIGVVETAAKEIQCGSTCIASFDAGSSVQLTTIADEGSESVFSSWGGDSDCYDGVVTMNSNVFCVARFEVYSPPQPTGDGGGGSGSSDCFIATAAYGSWLDPHVLTLREFRDRYLLTNAAGSWFVEFYYRHSPPIADYIREREGLRSVVRALLAVVVYTIEYPAAAGSLLLFATLLAGLRRRRRAVTNSSDF